MTKSKALFADIAAVITIKKSSRQHDGRVILSLRSKQRIKTQKIQTFSEHGVRVENFQYRPFASAQLRND